MPGISQVDALLQQELTGGKTPSLQYLFFDRQKILHTFTGGLANVASARPAASDTSYHAYSATKTFTALAILQLAEKNLLLIDEPVSRYWPEFPYGLQITTRHLLSHTAGIPNPVPLRWIHLAAEHEQFDPNRFFDGIIGRNARVQSPPNARFAYSNLGYILLGRLIERVSGIPFEDYIRQNILTPIGIGKTSMDFTIPDGHKHATGYHSRWSLSYYLIGLFLDKSKYFYQTEGKWKSFHNCYVNGAPYGGMIGTADAFARYLQELLSPESKLLSKASKAQLFTENRTSNGKGTGMCLSWFTGLLNGVQYFAHAGGGGGYYCEIRVYPSIGMGSVVFFNRTGMSDVRFLDRLDRFMVPV